MQVYHHSDVSQSSSTPGMIFYDSDSDFTENGPYMGKVLSRPVTLKQLLATLRQPGYLETEFRKLPPNHVDPSEIPTGAEKKNRYSNVLPCLRTRVPLGIQGNCLPILSSLQHPKYNGYIQELFSINSVLFVLV